LPIVDDILKSLENGRWHNLKEIEKKTQLDNTKVKSITEFLAKYNFILLDKEREKAKLNPSAQDFLKRIQKIEGEETR